MTQPAKLPRRPGLLLSLTPVVLLVLMLAYTVLEAKGPVQIPLLLATAIAAGVAAFLGYTWKEIEHGIMHGIGVALPACLILMVIGVLIGSWMQAGIVPAMVYYGLQLLDPGWFLFLSCFICSVISLATGSSWSTAATVGVALIGVGNALQVPVGMTAGAVISGAYFGDKMSPLSDTTNLSPAVAGTDLFSHVRHMVYTTGPSFVIALVLYGILGWRFRGNTLDLSNVQVMLDTLDSSFLISPWLLLVPAGVIAMVLLRIAAMPALFAGSLLGGLTALIVQPGVGLSQVVDVAFNGYVSTTGIKTVDDLLTRGGMGSMMGTVALIFCALAFGGVMEKSGMLGTLAEGILKLAHGTGSLVAATIGTCIGMNLIASDQYMAIVIPGRMYREAFRKRGLHPKNLSRCLEDAGTLTSSLVPWNTCGAFMHAALGVSPIVYLPFAFLNLINPMVSVFYGFTGITMTPLDPDDRSSGSVPAAVTAGARETAS